jgi:hypothetical protein
VVELVVSDGGLVRFCVGIIRLKLLRGCEIEMVVQVLIGPELLLIVVKEVLIFVVVIGGEICELVVGWNSKVIQSAIA